jgi:hypothetical protein
MYSDFRFFKRLILLRMQFKPFSIVFPSKIKVFNFGKKRKLSARSSAPSWSILLKERFITSNEGIEEKALEIYLIPLFVMSLWCSKSSLRVFRLIKLCEKNLKPSEVILLKPRFKTSKFLIKLKDLERYSVKESVSPKLVLSK